MKLNIYQLKKAQKSSFQRQWTPYIHTIRLHIKILGRNQLIFYKGFGLGICILEKQEKQVQWVWKKIQFIICNTHKIQLKNHRNIKLGSFVLTNWKTLNFTTILQQQHFTKQNLHSLRLSGGFWLTYCAFITLSPSRMDDYIASFCQLCTTWTNQAWL